MWLTRRCWLRNLTMRLTIDLRGRASVGACRTSKTIGECIPTVATGESVRVSVVLGRGTAQAAVDEFEEGLALSDGVGPVAAPD